MVTLSQGSLVSTLTLTDWLTVAGFVLTPTGTLLLFLYRFGVRFELLEQSVKNLVENVVKNHGERITRLESPYFERTKGD